MAFDYSGLGSAIGGISGGVGSLFASAGYAEGAALARQNAGIEKLSTGIKLTQENRKAYQVLGATESAAAGNGLSLGGSAMDVLKSNAQQLSLNKALVENQGLIEQHGWEEKAAADEGAAQAAQAGGIGSILGGALQVGALFL